MHDDVVPTGCTEQQGPHLAVDNDTWFAESLAVAAAEQVAPDVIAAELPALPYGPTPEHRGFGAGFVDIPVPGPRRVGIRSFKVIFARFAAAAVAERCEKAARFDTRTHGCSDGGPMNPEEVRAHTSRRSPASISIG